MGGMSNKSLQDKLNSTFLGLVHESSIVNCSCNLHINHNAFRHGLQTLNCTLRVEESVTDVFQLF
jgi:hypothetical protein